MIVWKNDGVGVIVWRDYEEMSVWCGVECDCVVW